MKLRWFVLVSMLVSGCFLKQEPPQGPVNPGKQAIVDGLVILEDIAGDVTEAYAKANFALSDSRTETPSRMGFKEPRLLLSQRANQCQVRKAPRPVDDRASVDVSIGKFWIGPALQSNLQEIPEKPDHTYYKSFTTEFPPGVYLAKAEGKEAAAGFEGNLSMPEALTGVVIKSSGSEDSLALKVGAALEMTWASPTFPNDQNLMLAELYALSAIEIFQLRCVVTEKEVSARGGIWMVPAAYTSVLPVTNEAEIYLSRVHAFAHQSKRHRIETQGRKTHYQKVEMN